MYVVLILHDYLAYLFKIKCGMLIKFYFIKFEYFVF